MKKVYHASGSGQWVSFIVKLASAHSLTLLKRPFAGHGPAPRGMYVVDLQVVEQGRALPICVP
jgi:hypothetical protein